MAGIFFRNYIGCGSLGTAILWNELHQQEDNKRMFLFIDGDRIEERNTWNNPLFSQNNVGQLKAIVLASICRSMGYYAHAITENLTEENYRDINGIFINQAQYNSTRVSFRYGNRTYITADNDTCHSLINKFDNQQLVLHLVGTLIEDPDRFIIQAVKPWPDGGWNLGDGYNLHRPVISMKYLSEFVDILNQEMLFNYTTQNVRLVNHHGSNEIFNAGEDNKAISYFDELVFEEGLEWKIF